MSGRTMFGRPRRHRHGAALTLVFGAVLATGATTGSFGTAADGPGPRATRTVPAPRPDTADVAWAIEEGELTPAAAARLVGRTGDRWSSYYTAAQYQGLRQELAGGYVGVGLWVRATAGGRITVSRVQAGSPARRAGLAVGDVLLAVGGAPVTGRPITEVVSRLRGVDPADPDDPATARPPAPGSPVRLVLRRAGRPLAVTLRRELLSTRPVTVGHPEPGVLSVAVGSFASGVGDRVRDAVAHGDHRDGVLLDLRGNSGGLVSEAVTVASVFLDGGLVATYDVHGRPHALSAGQHGDTATPLVVLVDGGTMSAAEMLTGALQDRGRAVVVGDRTFGKGAVQQPSTLPDGSAAELTVGHYRTPAGRAVDGRGIAPDVPLPAGTPASAAVGAAETVLSGLGARS